MAAAYLACILVVHSSFVDDVAGLARHQDRTPAMGVLVMSVGTNAFVLV
jgi:hypothetical protein